MASSLIEFVNLLEVEMVTHQRRVYNTKKQERNQTNKLEGILKTPQKNQNKKLKKLTKIDESIVCQEFKHRLWLVTLYNNNSELFSVFYWFTINEFVNCKYYIILFVQRKKSSQVILETKKSTFRYLQSFCTLNLAHSRLQLNFNTAPVVSLTILSA